MSTIVSVTIGVAVVLFLGLIYAFCKAASLADYAMNECDSNE